MSWGQIPAVFATAGSKETVEQEALRRLAVWAYGAVCSFPARRMDGETCRQSNTRFQAAPTAGCPVCDAREFLDRVALERGA